MTPEAADLLAAAAARAAAAALDVLPDPPVACVVLDAAGRPAGEGVHAVHGGPHAEAAALAAAGPAARGGTALVTLEPCGEHPGKRTPSCAAALRDAGVARVVYASPDPTAAAAGAGPALLRAAGIAVEHRPFPGLPDALARWRAAAADPFPWVVAKWAMSLDGRIADARGASRWISGPESRERVHALRARCGAVVVGARTAVLDDPDLRPRPGGAVAAAPPLRVVVDGSLRLPPGSALARTAREGPVLVACGDRAAAARREALVAAGLEVAAYPGPGGRVDLRALLLDLRRRGAVRVLVEGGGGLHGALLRAGLVRQVAAFVAPLLLGGDAAPAPVAGEAALRTAAAPLRLEEVRTAVLGGDLLVEGFVPRDGGAAAS